MAEALPEEEPSVLISAKALRLILLYVPTFQPEGRWQMLRDAIEEAESALERYK